MKIQPLEIEEGLSALNRILLDSSGYILKMATFMKQFFQKILVLFRAYTGLIKKARIIVYRIEKGGSYEPPFSFDLYIIENRASNSNDILRIRWFSAIHFCIKLIFR